MNKFLVIILTLVILLGLTFGWKVIMSEVDEYNQYKSFCKDRPTFCRCSWGECSFKTQWSSVTGLDQDTKDLCALADLFDDEKMIFEVGCE